MRAEHSATLLILMLNSTNEPPGNRGENIYCEEGAWTATFRGCWKGEEVQSFLVTPGIYLCKTLFVDCTALCCWDSLANLCRGPSQKDLTPTAPSVPRRSPIQVLTELNAA